MSNFDDLTTGCLRLLRHVGLAHAETILPLSRKALADRLTVATRDLGLPPGVTLDVLIEKVLTAAEDRRVGEITSIDLRDLRGQLPGSGTMVGSKGLPGHDDFPVWGRDRDLDEAALPGRDDFKPWGDDTGEDEPER